MGDQTRNVSPNRTGTQPQINTDCHGSEEESGSHEARKNESGTEKSSDEKILHSRNMLF
jgi:hypothetical protein